MTGLAPGALYYGRAIGSLSGSGAVPAVRASNWHPFRKKGTLQKKSGFPASPIPACAPDIVQDFLANATGRDVPRLELIRNMDRAPVLLDIGVANMEAVCAEETTGRIFRNAIPIQMESMCLRSYPGSRPTTRPRPTMAVSSIKKPLLTLIPFLLKCERDVASGSESASFVSIFSFCDRRVLSRSGGKAHFALVKSKTFQKNFFRIDQPIGAPHPSRKRIIPPCALSCFCHISYLNSLNRRGTLRANLKPIHSGIRFSLAFCFCDRKKAA